MTGANSYRGSAPPSPALGEILRRYRGSLSMYELAKRAGVTHATISRIESGQRGMGMRSLALLGTVLGEAFIGEVLTLLTRED